MTKLYAFVLALIFLTCCNQYLKAQATSQGPPAIKKDSTGKAVLGKSSFRIGASFANNNVFLGRSDTIRTAVLVPNAKYTFGNGLYVGGSLYLIPQQQKKLNGGSLTAGYDHDITDDLTFGVSASKIFYNATSTQVGSSVRGSVSASLDYDLGDILSASLNGDYNFNKTVGNDAVVNFGLSHDFDTKGVFGDNDFILVSPTVAVNAGTQNFYDDFLVKFKQRNIKAYLAQSAALSAYQQQLAKFNILDYELSVPIIYKTGPLVISFVPNYSIAKNKLPAGVLTGVSVDNNLFYFQAGVALKF